MSKEQLSIAERKQALQKELEQLSAQEEAEKIAIRKKHETDRDEFLHKTIAAFKEANTTLRRLKEETIVGANKFHMEMYALHGKEPKPQKNITIESSCGKYKVVAESKEIFQFTPEAQIHIDAIREILQNKFQDRNKGMFDFMETFLMKNSKGEYDPKLLAKAKQKAREKGYLDMLEELDNLQDCQTVSGTALYCRAYEKTDNNSWKNIPVQFSKL